MKLKPNLETEYQSYVTNNSDPYGKGVVNYGEKWATIMEAQIPDDATEEQAISVLVRDDFAKKSSHEVDTEGVTGFMYVRTVKALAHFWVHGEALRRWYNKDCQIGTEGDKANETGGVLNPAIICMK